MVSSIGYQLAKSRKITGFGRRVPVTRIGSGAIRRTVGNIARPALGWIANRIADAISGSGRKKVYRRTVRGSSFKLSGAGRKPRSRLSISTRKRKVGTGIKRRAPRRSLAGLRKHRVTHRVLC